MLEEAVDGNPVACVDRKRAANLVGGWHLRLRHAHDNLRTAALSTMTGQRTTAMCVGGRTCWFALLNAGVENTLVYMGSPSS